MGSKGFQKLKVQSATIVVASTLQHHLSVKVTGIADFVISKFVFVNTITIIFATRFQDISNIFSKIVISSLNRGVLFPSMIYSMIKTHAQSCCVYIHIRHIICSRNMKL